MSEWEIRAAIQRVLDQLTQGLVPPARKVMGSVTLGAAISLSVAQLHCLDCGASTLYGSELAQPITDGAFEAKDHAEAIHNDLARELDVSSRDAIADDSDPFASGCLAGDVLPAETDAGCSAEELPGE